VLKPVVVQGWHDGKGRVGEHILVAVVCHCVTRVMCVKCVMCDKKCVSVMFRAVQCIKQRSSAPACEQCHHRRVRCTHTHTHTHTSLPHPHTCGILWVKRWPEVKALRHIAL
jgi:hypothetical protein